jgi:hypothetical protein
MTHKMTFLEIERELVKRRSEDPLFEHSLEMLRQLHTGLVRAQTLSKNYDNHLASMAEDATAYLQATTNGPELR